MSVRCVVCSKEAEPILGGEGGWRGSLRPEANGAQRSEWWCPECWAGVASSRRLEAAAPAEDLWNDATRFQCRCADCRKLSPITATPYSLIGPEHAWRRTVRTANDGLTVTEWRCPDCWQAHKTSATHLRAAAPGVADDADASGKR